MAIEEGFESRAGEVEVRVSAVFGFHRQRASVVASGELSARWHRAGAPARRGSLIRARCLTRRGCWEGEHVTGGPELAGGAVRVRDRVGLWRVDVVAKA